MGEIIKIDDKNPFVGISKDIRDIQRIVESLITPKEIGVKLNPDIFLISISLERGNLIKYDINNYVIRQHIEVSNLKDAKLINDNVTNKGYKPIFVTEINLAAKDADFTEKEINNSDCGMYTGWIYFYKKIFNSIPLEEWENEKWRNKTNIIFYTRFPDYLEDYFKKPRDLKEQVAYLSLKNAGYIIRPNGGRFSKEEEVINLVKKCNEVGNKYKNN